MSASAFGLRAVPARMPFDAQGNRSYQAGLALFAHSTKGKFMSRRSAVVKIATKAGMLFGALFVVTVLLAAIPAHQQKPLEISIPQDPALTQPAAASHPSATDAPQPATSHSISRAQPHCCTRGPRRDTTWSARCAPCPSAPAKTN
jgi:hypothetical protein